MAENNYPLAKFHIQVEWGDDNLAFSECSGLHMETEPIEYRDGISMDLSKIKMPGMQKYSNLTLKRGTFKGQNTFYEWWNTTKSAVERRDVIITLLNEEHSPVFKWTAINAWPLKVQSTDLKADGNEVAIETLEIAHEGIAIEAV